MSDAFGFCGNVDSVIAKSLSVIFISLSYFAQGFLFWKKIMQTEMQLQILLRSINKKHLLCPLFITGIFPHMTKLISTNRQAA